MTYRTRMMHALIYQGRLTFGGAPWVTALSASGPARWKLMGEGGCEGQVDDGVLYVLAGFWDSAEKRAGMVDWMRSKQ